MADDNTKLLIIIEAQNRKLQNQLTRSNKMIDNFARKTEKRFELMNKQNAASFTNLNRQIKGSMGGLRSAIAPLTAALSVREIINYSDAWTEAGNKIAAASQISGLQARSLDELKEGANGARASLEQYVDLYSRLLRTSGMVGASELEVARATDIVAKSLKAGGASTQEQTASLIQLGQAISSGFLQGDELRSLRENAPLLAKAIAEEFGVTIGELKKLGAEGELTSDRVFKAIINGGDAIEEAFKTTKSTIRDAFTRIDNEFTAYVGNAGDANGATQGLIDALNYLAENFEEVAEVVIQLATILAGALAGRAIGAVVVSSGQAVMALGALLAAMRAGTVAAVTFSAAMGPISILVGAASAALYLLWNEHQKAERVAAAYAKTVEANGAAIEVAKDASDEFRKRLKQQAEAQLVAAKAALEEAKAQAQVSNQRAMMLRQMAAVPLFGGIASGAAAAFDSLALAGGNTLAENAKFINELEAQLAEIDRILLTPAGESDRASSGASSKSGKDAKKNAYQKALDNVEKRTVALEAEVLALETLNPLIDDYGFAVEKAKVETDLYLAAKEAGLKVDKDLISQIQFLAAAQAQAAVDVKKLGEAHEETRKKAEDFRDTSKDIMRGFVDDIVAGTDAMESLGNALNKIGNKLLDLGFDALFGGGNTKGFGAIGSLFGFADGGYTGGGGKNQPAGIVHKGEYVFDQQATKRIGVPNLEALSSGSLMSGPTSAASVSPQSVGASVVYAPSIDARGADAHAVAKIERILTKDRAEFSANVVKIMRGAKNGRVKV